MVLRSTIFSRACSGMFPPQTSMWGRWSPKKERTVLMGVSNAIAYLGNLASNILTALICEKLGWQWAFYIYGIIGIIWSVAWILFFRNSPAEMPWIDLKELQYIESDLDSFEDSTVEFKEIPWCAILTSGSFWATNASGFAASITEFTVVEMAPEYMKDVQGFNLLGSGALASLPFIINLIVVFIACISLDFLLHKGDYDKTKLRKIWNLFAFVPAIVTLCFISLCGCNSAGVITLICIAYGMRGFGSAVQTPTFCDMAPRLAGVLHGIGDACYSAGGFVVPLMINAMITDDPYLISSWNVVWYVCAGFSAAGVIVYWAFATCEEQQWHKDMVNREKPTDVSNPVFQNSGKQEPSFEVQQ